MAIFDLFAGGVGLPSGSQVRGPPRIAMAFSSKMRLDAAQEAAGSAIARMTGSTAGAAAPDSGSSALGRLIAHYGTPNVMTTINMAVNPNSIRSTQGKRIVKRDTQEGSVFFHFCNSKGQNNDLAVLTFAGSTGNIDLRGSNQPGVPGVGAHAIDTGALYKLIAWHNLYALTREPMLVASRIRNLFFIQMTTPLFPFQGGLLLMGHFNQVLSYEETAAKPHSRTYNFEFTVKATEPDMDTVIGTVSDLQASQQLIDQNITTGTAPLGQPSSTFATRVTSLTRAANVAIPPL